MKHWLVLVLFHLCLSPLISQILDPVQWTFEVEALEDGTYRLQYIAEMDEHWHLYSQHLDTTKIGPVPTSFDHDEVEGITFLGPVEEPEPIVDYDPNFEMDIPFFEERVVFTQSVELDGVEGAVLTGMVNYMTCDDSKCIFPEPAPYSFTLGEGATGDGQSASGILEPVDWTFSAAPVEGSDSQYDITLRAEIDEHWHLYSQNLESDFGPVPTTFTFADSSGGFTLIGETQEGEPLVSYDPNFDMDLSYFEGTADFVQRIEMDESNSGFVEGMLTFMVCDDSKCLPPEDIPFKIDLKTGKAVDLSGATGSITNDPALEGRFQLANVDLENPIIECGEAQQTETNLWNIFFLGFLGGLVALLTPCVFPMIPLTVSFFTKGSEDRAKGIRRAFLYGFFIFAIYLLLSLPFHLLDGINPDILNSISTNIWLNLVFFVVFIVFAISFFGYFEITLPSSFTNKMDDKASSIGGLIGIFFMALTLALVSFSCTGPILGSLLAGSLTNDGGAMQLTAGFGGFGLALALPFALFAAFPGWMNSLPQSGGWLNSVKVVLGFVEVALAFKFLSNADLVGHWEVLKIEPFLIVWILCAIGLALYLFGKLKFPHDSPLKKISAVRMILGLASVAFAIYLISGFRYNEKTETFTSLELLSGLAPPVGYSFIYPSECPHALECFHDFDEGMAYAQSTGKPVLLDFTGYACVNCRKMEEHVWPEPEIMDMIKDEYVLVSLYVDDSKELPEEEQVEYTLKNGKTRTLKTYGNKWSTLQAETFNINSQPFYVLLSPEGTLLNNPVPYTPDKEEYANFLRCGLDAHQQLAQGR
ncbi:MAG: hypothetical protein HKN79_05565 [Flavobacteriales bacterium]|nr:hypothetical protein [Flavobacteriales bacterium]